MDIFSKNHGQWTKIQGSRDLSLTFTKNSPDKMERQEGPLPCPAACSGMELWPLAPAQWLGAWAGGWELRGVPSCSWTAEGESPAVGSSGWAAAGHQCHEGWRKSWNPWLLLFHDKLINKATSKEMRHQECRTMAYLALLQMKAMGYC